VQCAAVVRSGIGRDRALLGSAAAGHVRVSAVRDDCPVVSATSRSTQRVIVVGGGIAGLVAAYDLAGNPDLDVLLLEAAPRVGGKLLASEIAGVRTDAGAEAFLVRDPAAVELVMALGLEPDLVHPATSTAGIWVGGQAQPVPRGTVMGVPSRVDSLAPLLSAAGLRRALDGARGSYEPVREDISIGALVAAQLGPEVVARAVEPLLGGVYAGRADLLSLRSTVPALWSALHTDGSVVRAAAAAAPIPADGPPAPVFGTLRHGLCSLVVMLVDMLPGLVRTGVTVRELDRTVDGFRLVTGPVPAPEVLHADAVVLAVPAPPAARLLRDVAPAASVALGTVDYASTALVRLAYAPGTQLPAGSGLLVPADQGYVVKALTYSGQKWAHLADGPVLVRASVGRYGDVAVLQRDDDDLVALVAGEVAALTGVTAAPLDTDVTRWGGALPQYAVGHADLVDRVRTSVADVPGLAVCGATYGGVGIPACVRSGRAAAAQVASTLRAARQSGHG